MKNAEHSDLIEFAVVMSLGNDFEIVLAIAHQVVHIEACGVHCESQTLDSSKYRHIWVPIVTKYVTGSIRSQEYSHLRSQ